MGLRLLIGTLCLALPLPAQFDPKAPLKPEVILLARVRNVASETFAQLPNCTCTLTIERSRRTAGSRQFKPVDTVRLEVALVNGKELFAWPGEKQFEERDIGAMVGGNSLIGYGEFAGHARAILLSSKTSVTYVGKEQRDGRELHRFDFARAREESDYTIRFGSLSGEVGYAGSFWVDPVSMDVQRIEFAITEIPPGLPLLGSFQSIEYERRKVGDAAFLLPVVADTEMTNIKSQTDRNRTHFENCRQFVGESTLTFDEPVTDTPSAPPAVNLDLPAKLRISTKPAVNVDLRKIARGDLIDLVTDKAATMRDRTWLPKGAQIKVRVHNVVCIGSPYSTCMAALRPESVGFENSSGGFTAELESPPNDPMAGSFNDRAAYRALISKMPNLPEDVAIVVVRGGRMSSSLNLVWRTLESRE